MLVVRNDWKRVIFIVAGNQTGTGRQPDDRPAIQSSGRGTETPRQARTNGWQALGRDRQHRTGVDLS